MLNSKKILLQRETQEKDPGTQTNDEHRGPFTVHNCVVCGQHMLVVQLEIARICSRQSDK